MATVSMTPPPTTQVLIKELCRHCRGTGQVAGLPGGPHVTCAQCEGSGMARRWVNLLELYDLIAADRRCHRPDDPPLAGPPSSRRPA